MLIPQDLFAWTQALAFDGVLAVAEPKKLRHRILHAAAVVVRTGRQTVVRFQQSWPWTIDIVNRLPTTPRRPARLTTPTPIDGTTLNTRPTIDEHAVTTPTPDPRHE